MSYKHKWNVMICVLLSTSSCIYFHSSVSYRRGLGPHGKKLFEFGLFFSQNSNFKLRILTFFYSKFWLFLKIPRKNILEKKAQIFHVWSSYVDSASVWDFLHFRELLWTNVREQAWTCCFQLWVLACRRSEHWWYCSMIKERELSSVRCAQEYDCNDVQIELCLAREPILSPLIVCQHRSWASRLYMHIFNTVARWAFNLKWALN